MCRAASWSHAIAISVTLAVTVGNADHPATETTQAKSVKTKPADSIREARARARVLHEAFHGALQVMHRDFFDDENARILPSVSLEDVFSEMERTHGIKVRWLAVSARAMNTDHEPQDAFESKAVKALASGEEEFEELRGGEYYHVGSIRLASQCLKCHLPNRTSTKDRAAGLSISMRVASQPDKEPN